MGFVDKVKNKTTVVLNKAKEVVIGKSMAKKPIMKVTMMGARGVGKTSVLTSMYRNMNSAVNNTKLHISAESGTEEVLIGKVRNLKDMFLKDNKLGDEVQSGIAGDKTVTTFDFDFGFNTENAEMGIEIKDFPGEYVKDEPETVKSYIDESNAIIIAIDTPHLMECDGKYNEAKNRTSAITEFFKKTLNEESDEKLVMLVPLKCEKYYIEGRINEVSKKVKETYIELLRFLFDKENEHGLKGKIACVVAPILTLGEIQFSGFDCENEEVCEVRTEDGLLLPRKVNYSYVKPNADYAPKYCEQPLYYLLSFVSKQYVRMKETSESKGLLGKLFKMLEVSPKVNDLFVEIHKLSINKIEKEDGYEIYFGQGKV